MAMKKCLLCGQEAERLARSHIFARGFFNGLPSKARVDSVSLSNGAGRKLQSALYDEEIICDDCEHGIMQPLDDYGIKVIRDRETAFHIPLPAEQPMGMYVFKGVDKRKIRAFLASVLWRCSVSRLPEMKDISIGPVYGERIRQELLTSGEFNYVDMVLFYLTHPMHGAFLLPARKRLRPLDTNRDHQIINGWMLHFPNISITVSLDKRSHPHRMFLLLEPDLTPSVRSLLVSSSLNPDATEYNLLALESKMQKNHYQHIIHAIQRRGMKSHIKPIQSTRYPCA